MPAESVQIPSCPSTVSSNSQREEENCFIQTQCSQDYLVNVSGTGEQHEKYFDVQLEDSYNLRQRVRTPRGGDERTGQARRDKFEVSNVTSLHWENE